MARGRYGDASAPVITLLILTALASSLKVAVALGVGILAWHLGGKIGD